MVMSLLYLKKFKITLTRELIENGEVLPKGYGFAWRDFDTACMIAYPIPFNVLFRGIRRLWHWIKIGQMKSSKLDKIWEDGYSQGCKNSTKMFNAQYMALSSQVNKPTKK